ncbi:MAG TPA: hypothetical protein DCS43_13730 [Verrucomicrobia bacterium]|nr:hypothetical protein [Verrucomicrobiota bacterium]
MNTLEYIQTAEAQGNAICRIYSRLRNAPSLHERTELLRQAEKHAETLGNALRQVAETNPVAGQATEETIQAMQSLNTIMEQVMIQEREYRISAGGDDTP